METKIPFYNLVNIFLLGLLFITGLAYITAPRWVVHVEHYEILFQLANQWTFLLSLIAIGVIYEIGVIINRISSIIVENICERWGLIHKKEENYAAFNVAKKEYPFLYTLSREYGFSRGNLTLWLILAIISVCYKDWGFGLVSLLLSVLFLFSMRKFSSKIQSIIKDYIHEKQ